MKVYEILIEYSTSKLDRLFSYVYFGKKEIKKLCRVVVDFANKNIVGIVIDIKEDDYYQEKTGFELKEIQEVLDDEPLLNEELFSLTNEISSFYYSPRISVIFSMLPPSLKPSKSSKNKPKIAYEQIVKVIDDVTLDDLTKKQRELYFLIKEKGELTKRDCSSCLTHLLNKEKVYIEYREIKRSSLKEVNKKEKYPLNEEQLNCYQTILSSSKDTFLLEGITGSGKTEVYLQLAEKIIEEGKQVLMLVPEIALSYQMVERFQERFSRVAIFHSKLTAGQRYDEYRRIKNQEVDIVVGARSAIFAPLENIGLLIIDEEHAEAYKQEDKTPYYHVLDVAKMRQKTHHFKLVLGSATPSLETKSRALKGIYEHLFLTKRINGLPLPKVNIVDMLDRKNIDQESILISKPLKEAIRKRLDNHEQTILLVNRRGYSPYISCRECGHVVKCPSCQVALTYHKEINRLSCHHCGFETKMIINCPKCNSNKIFKAGFGTERILSEIEKLFPESKVLRLDADTMRKANALDDILTSFASHQADILIGTQIVSKGHDFKDVTLVGVVLADIGLALPSFRANEKTFSLITQAIGRSGRNKLGEAYIQTYLKDNFVIKNAAKQDYLSFYATEIHLRKIMQNPPYTFVTLLLISGEKEEEVISTIEEVCAYINMKVDNELVRIIGPSEMFIKRYQNLYRRKIVLKYKDFSLIKPILDDLMLFFNKKSSVKLTINVNPYEDY